jgi:hypothetical protein
MGRKQRARKEAERAAGEPDLEAELEKLTPEQAEMFVRALELAMKKRRVLLAGHLLAILALITGSALAFYLYGTGDPDSFRGWVFLIPLATAAVLYIGFGKLARRIKK